jgi:ribonuclease G
VSSKEIFISVTPGETRIALRDNNRLCALDIERDPTLSAVGNIYIGRAQKIVQGIQAAFINIGMAQSGFLALPEIKSEFMSSKDKKDRIEDYINEGDAVCVQVLRDAIADKGPKITTHIKLVGRYVVMALNDNRIHVSRRIDDADGKRLQKLVEKNCAGNEGYIIRTAAAAASDELILCDIKALQDLWQGIQEKFNSTSAPSKIHTDLSPSLRMIQDTVDRGLSKIIIDDPQTFQEINKFCKERYQSLVNSLELYSETLPLFETNNIEEEIETALAPQVNLASGPRIFIEETAALTAVDVDTASASRSGRPEDVALECNVAAATAIVHQLKLRNIGGYIVIDFVPMRRKQNEERVLAVLRKQFHDDPCPTFIGGYTRLGKVELNRQRQRQSLAELLLTDTAKAEFVQRPKSSTTIAFEVLRRVQQGLKTNPGKTFELKAASSVIAILQSGVAKKGLNQLNEILGGPLVMTKQDTVSDYHYEVLAHHGASRS